MMKVRRVLPLTALLLLLICQGDVRAAARCIDCHSAQEFSGKTVHRPVAQGHCTQCHNPHVARFEGLLQKQGSDLCYSCHAEAKKAFGQGVQHQPIQDGQCLACHNAHASDRQGLLARPLAESCFKCHDVAAREYPVLHKPFASGNCGACHQPHNADNFQFLRDDGDTLCLTCHSRPEALAGHNNFPGQAGACLTCHNPHGGQDKGLIRQHVHAPFATGCTSCHGGKGPQGSELCLSCHAGVREQMRAPHSHMLAGANGCVECHSPHAADTAGLLRAPYEQLCRSCHTNTFDRNRQSLHAHPPTEKCTDCHEPHGGQRLVMLNADGNGVCSSCHETQGEFSHPVGSDVVDHRTGLGMNCLTCHDPMGTEYRYHLKLSGKKALCVQCHRSY